MAETNQTEVLFYHLERVPLERVLPELLERTLERGWRAAVQASSTERLEALDTLLWTFREGSFLPHGRSGEGPAERHPVYLTTDDDNPNGADVRFFVDGAAGGEIAGYQRAVYLFDGLDEEAVSQAREHWKAAQASGFDVTYWQQDDKGRWEKKA